MKTPLIVTVCVMFFHALVFSRNNNKDTDTNNGDTIVSAIFMMTIPSGGTVYDSIKKKYTQYEIYRTTDNKYLQVTIDYKAKDLEYVKDSIPLFIGDTEDLSINYSKPLAPAFLQDTLLPNLYDSGYPTEFENLRELLIKYPPVKPCEYWNVDTNYSFYYIIPTKYLVPTEQPLEGTADYDENPDLGMIKRDDKTSILTCLNYWEARRIFIQL